MARRLLPASLGFAALVADLEGAHGLALATLFVAIPAAFVLVLECYGDALEARCSGLRPLLAAGGLVLLLLSAALRSPAVVGGVPRLAVSAILFALVLYAAVAVGALVPSARRLQPAWPEAESVEDERLAA